MSSIAMVDSPRLELPDVMRRATESLCMLNLKCSGVTGVSKLDDGWRVTLELVERKAVPDTMDLIGVYDVHLDACGSLTGYERIRVRRRCDLDGA